MVKGKSQGQAVMMRGTGELREEMPRAHVEKTSLRLR